MAGQAGESRWLFQLCACSRHSPPPAAHKEDGSGVGPSTARRAVSIGHHSIRALGAFRSDQDGGLRIMSGCLGVGIFGQQISCMPSTSYNPSHTLLLSLVRERLSCVCVCVCCNPQLRDALQGEGQGEDPEQP